METQAWNPICSVIGTAEHSGFLPLGIEWATTVSDKQVSLLCPAPGLVWSWLNVQHECRAPSLNKSYPSYGEPLQCLVWGWPAGLPKTICRSWGGDLDTLTVIAMLFGRYLGWGHLWLQLWIWGNREMRSKRSWDTAPTVCSRAFQTHSGTGMQGWMFDIYGVSQACFSNIFRKKKGPNSSGSQQLGWGRFLQWRRCVTATSMGDTLSLGEHWEPQWYPALQGRHWLI